jgi:hypothetical protein
LSLCTSFIKKVFNLLSINKQNSVIGKFMISFCVTRGLREISQYYISSK